MPRVAVVTGYYNRVHLLERTIESILSQTFQDFELIVFDDNSTDGTAERLAELSIIYDDPRFRYVVHGENKGFVRGLKDVIDEVKAEYIAIQGSGDASLPRRLELQVELLDRQPEVGAVGGWYSNVQEAQGTHRLSTANADNLVINDLYKNNIFSHGEVMIRRSAYERAGGYREEFKYAQDRDLWLRIAKFSNLATIPEPIYKRYVQFDGVSYVPEKRASQACYSIAAVELAQLSPEDENSALSKLGEEGPESIVSVDDPRVQANLTKSAIRLILFGSPQEGIRLAETTLTSRLSRLSLRYFGRLMKSPASKLTSPVLHRLAGIKKG